MWTRRDFFRNASALTLGVFANRYATGEEQAMPPDTLYTSGTGRTFHYSVSPDALDAAPDLLETVKAAGVTHVWLPGFLYGYYPYPMERLHTWRRRAEALGLDVNIVTVPLGHPGDSLGAMHGDIPLTPPARWRMGVKPDGKEYSGTSLHDPATEENRIALKELAAQGYRRVFLDDDFRLAASPGIIGGCFCAEHQARFLNAHGHGEAQWAELLADVAGRDLSPLLREWVSFTCDDLTACFRAQQQAAPELSLGVMVMYMGAEKAGIRLADYADTPFRVGELHFSDNEFASVKGKTNELFSVLFHRRFIKPEFAYSETTAYPADQLSARNMAAKLAISTLADVRHTMFMSGLTTFPIAHWDTLGPAIKKQTQAHAKLAGQRPAGPCKHFWGEGGRYVGDDNPFSLFLAMGLPFEVVDTPGQEGWTFCGEFDTAEAVKAGARVVSRSPVAGEMVEETLAAMWALKKRILTERSDPLHIVEEHPAVLAWYPAIQTAAIWNLAEEPVKLTLRHGGFVREIQVEGLGLEVVEGV